MLEYVLDLVLLFSSGFLLGVSVGAFRSRGKKAKTEANTIPPDVDKKE